MDTNLMIYVGRFNEQDLKDGKDKDAIKEKKQFMPDSQIHCKDVMKRGKTVALDVWLY